MKRSLALRLEDVKRLRLPGLEDGTDEVKEHQFPCRDRSVHRQFDVASKSRRGEQPDHAYRNGE